MSNNKRLVFHTILILLMWITPAAAFWGSQSAGTTGANFLKIGVGARAVGMGGAFVAIANDATSSYWNPAGLSQLEQQEVAFTHNEWLGNIKYEYLGYGLPLGKRTGLGVGLIYLHMGSIPGYDRQGNSTSSFTAYDAAMLLGLSRQLNQNTSLGIGLKWISQKLESENSRSFALDMGCLWKMDNFSVGLTVNNVGTPIKFIREEFVLPSKIGLGLAYRTLDDKLVFAADFDFPNDTKPIFKQGLEYNYQNSLFLRSGCQYRSEQNVDEKTELSFGGGFRMLNCDLDYTYSPDYGVGSVHRISISYKFGPRR